MIEWCKCEDKTLTLGQFEGLSCIQAPDLARKLDMNSRVKLFTRVIDGKRHYYCGVSPDFYVPYDAVFGSDVENRRIAERFRKWVETGHLKVTDGAEIDYREILEDAKADNLNNPIDETAIDPHGRPIFRTIWQMKA